MSDNKFNLDKGLIHIGFLTTIVLMIFKVTHIIDISFLWVFMPIIIAFGLLFLAIFFIGLVVVFIMSVTELPFKDNSEIDDESDTND